MYHVSLITCHVWHVAAGYGRVASWWCWCLYTAIDMLFCLPNMHSNPQAQPLPAGSVVAVAPAITLVKGWATTTQLHIHFTHTASQPVRLPSPLRLPVSSLLCSALSYPPSYFSASPTTISISTWYGSKSSLTPLTLTSLFHFTPLSHSLPHQWQGSEKYTKDRSRAGARVGRWRPKGWRWRTR